MFHYLDLIEVMGLEQPILMGASLGGWIATEFAIRYAGMLRALILVDPLGLRVPGAQTTDLFQLDPAPQDQGAVLIEVLDDRVVDVADHRDHEVGPQQPLQARDYILDRPGVHRQGRVPHHLKGARLGFDGLMICIVGAIIYVVGYVIISSITGNGC